MAGIHAMMFVGNGSGGGGGIEGEIYLKPNGVTIAAQPTAEKGKWHSFKGKDYYVAIDYNDLKSVVSVYKSLRGSGEVFADLTRDGQTKSIPLNQVVTTFVDSFAYLFDNARTFNQSIGSWDASNVTNMYCTFRRCHVFNQPIGSWNVSNVTDMRTLFDYCKAFAQNLSGWCVSKIKSKPQDFDYSTSTAWTTAMKPNWGAAC